MSFAGHHSIDQFLDEWLNASGLPYSTSCHTFRATGITEYLKNGGTLEKAQTIANHESAKTIKLYDRRSDEISLDEV